MRTASRSHWINCQPDGRSEEEDGDDRAVPRPDTGTLRWSRTQARIIRGPNGERLAISIFHDMTEERRSRERLRFLAEAGATAAGSLDIDQTLEALVRVASTTLADWAVVILTTEDGTVEHIASAHRDPEKAALAGDLHQRHYGTPAARSCSGRRSRPGSRPHLRSL